MTNASTDRKSQFAHFLNHTTDELEYRLLQVIEVCADSLQQFERNKKSMSGNGRELNYRFAAFSSLVQTLKDILPVLTGSQISWSSLSGVRHINFIKQSRNAITHDGNHVINLWTDGRFYVACDFVRINDKGKPVLVKVPSEDIATICLEFTTDFASKIHHIVEPIKNNNDFTAPMYGTEFFDKAIEHPAIPEFAKNLYKDSPVKSDQLQNTAPLSEVCQKLESLVGTCNNHMK